MEEDRMPKKIFNQEIEGTRKRGRPGKRWKEEIERYRSSAGSEKMERVGGRWEKMEGHCSTGQSPQWAVVPMEEEEEEEKKKKWRRKKKKKRRMYFKSS
jgi:hypothetical protein